MADPITQEHDLEDHIQLLRKLDAVRKRSAELRDEGIEVLMERLHPPEETLNTPVFGDWRHENSLVLRALLTRHDQPFSKAKDKEKEETRLKLIKSLTSQLQNGLTLEKLAEHELSVLAAASILRVLAAQPGAAFSEEAMLCYYWIIRELYSADRSDWNIGGARAAPGGLVTAFTTGECIRALLSFADALRNTGDFILEAGNYITRTVHLDNLSAYYFPDQSHAPLKEWVEAEKERMSLSCLLKLKRLSHYLVLALPPDQSERALSVETYLQVTDVTKPTEFKQKLENLLGDTEKSFETTLATIVAYRKKEYGDETNSTCLDELESDKKTLATCEERLYGFAKSDLAISPSLKTKADVTRSVSAHLIAFQAVQDARKRVGEKFNLVKNCDDTNIKTFENVCKDIKRGFDESAHQVEKLLHPIRTYLSSVLDRELALVSLGETWDWQPCELACAAASYGKLAKKWEKDVRFSRAVSDLSKMISSRGRFANLRHVHEQPDGPRTRMGNAASLHAMAQLLHHACDSEIENNLADNMLRFFEDTRAAQAFDIWSFRVMDITPELITKLDNHNDARTSYIWGKLPKEIQDLLTLVTPHTETPDVKPTVLAKTLAGELTKELNKLVQADPIDKDGDTNPFIDIGKDIRKKLDGEKMEQGEKYFHLLNRLCLQEAFSEKIRVIDLTRAVKQTSSDKRGWDWEYSQPPLRADLKATARAVMALAKINEMLDTHINHIILEHFSVKEKNKGLSEDLTLDLLFYPDYGLRVAPSNKDQLKQMVTKPRWIDKKDWPDEGIERKSSVAITLQRMRAHVSGVSLPEGDPLYSLVLHGPAGTGKTTLVEALAVSCDVQLIEVTPSDLVKYGEADLEQRARAVFEALSMLTHVVILFDEFDPVLKRRGVDSDKPLDVFSFLTPGMLPKLKDLNNGAKIRRVAYVLVTNLIGKLDEAAVRQGRFDERLGIYPPDLLSRTGRFLDQIWQSKWMIENTIPVPDGKEWIKTLSTSGFAKGNVKLSVDKINKKLECKPSASENNELTCAPISQDNNSYDFEVVNHGCKGILHVEINNLLDDASNCSMIPRRPELEKLAEVISRTRGKGMTALGPPGWFKHADKPKVGTPFDYVKGGTKFDDPEADDELKAIQGKGRTAVLEWLQWAWVSELDNKFHENATFDNLCKVLGKKNSN